jgi:hypothetical protein
MAWKWFVQIGDKVEGPMRTEEVQSRIQAGVFPKQALIWAAGLEHWQNLQSWMGEVGQMSLDSGKTEGPEAWHYAVGGQSKGPLSREAMVQEIKTLSGAGEIMLWCKGMKEWVPLYEFHDLLSEVGMNKRQFPRAELSGKAVIKGSGTTLIAPLLSLSEGGFGVALDSGPVSGEVFTVELQSSSFREPLHAKAEVRYLGEGVVGFKFTHLNVETKSLVIQFIKQSQMRFPIKAA